MDPVLIKFSQLILAEIAGILLCFTGVYLFIKGLTGRQSFIFRGAGITGRITNAAPGTVVIVIGLAIIYMSLDSNVLRNVFPEHKEAILQQWNANTSRVTDKTSYGELIDIIVGKDPKTRFVTRSLELNKPSTLSEIASTNYQDASMWRLVAAINKDRKYFTFSKATPQTKIARGAFIEIWQVSRYNGQDVETRTRVSTLDRTAAYDELLSRAASGEKFDFSKLSDESKSKELDLAYTLVPESGIKTLREASIRYYGDPKYWPLISWANPQIFTTPATENTDLPTDQKLYVIHFIGWPR